MVSLMLNAHIAINSAEFVFLARSIVSMRDAAAYQDGSGIRGVCAMNTLSANIDSPPPIFTLVKYFASQVNRDIKGKFLFGISCNL